MELPQLMKEIHDFQMHNRYLIVIDEMWQLDHSNMLKPIFSIASENCKVVLTTRNGNVASQECRYKLDFLTED